MTRKAASTGAAISFAITALLTFALVVTYLLVSGGSAKGESSTSTPTGSAPATSAPPKGNDINDKAANWVRMIYVNFKDAGQPPAECQNWVPKVDLTTVQFYYNESGKETAEAFGPDFGSTPCEVARNLVERLYRDPMLLVDKASEIGIQGAPANTPASIEQLQKAPFAEREALADKVLGFYAEPSRTLVIVQRDEAYDSRGANASGGGVPTTSTSSADKASNVLVTYDKSGNVAKMDRLNCGLQEYKPKPPPTSPPTQPPATPQPTCSPSMPHGKYPLCKDDPSKQVLNNPDVPDQVKGHGTTPVGTDPGPASKPVDSSTGCNGSCSSGGSNNTPSHSTPVATTPPEVSHPEPVLPTTPTNQSGDPAQGGGSGSGSGSGQTCGDANGDGIPDASC